MNTSQNDKSERLAQIASRLLALPEDKQSEFVRWLEERGIEPVELPIVAGARPPRVPASFAQRRLWWIDQLESGSVLYNVPRVLSMHGSLDARALERAIGALVERHEVLRTTFAESEGDAVQVVGDPRSVQLQHVDLSALAPALRRPRALELATREACTGFDLTRGPVFRATLLRLSADEHWLLFTLHHIATDEWSDGILAGELLELYDAFGHGREPELPALQIQYSDFALWQRRWLTRPVLERQLAYWMRELGSDDYALSLPLDFPERASASYAGGSYHFELGAELSRRIGEFSRQRNVTLFTTLLAAYHLLLHRLSGQTDIRVGTPVANRNRPEVERLIGFFANTQVLKSEVSGRLPFSIYLDRVRRMVTDAQANQDLPFERLVETLAPERKLAHTPLFQVMFSWHREDQRERHAVPGLTILQERVDEPLAKFDLTLHMTDSPSGLVGQFSYRSELFRESTMVLYAERLRRLLEEILEKPERPIADLHVSSAEEREQILRASGARRPAGERAPALAAPSFRSLHGWIAAEAAARPESLAVRSESLAINYRELEARANHLAAWLLRQGVKPEARVGLCLQRSVDLIVALYAVLKCGAAYVPLEPKLPAARLRDVLADAGIELVLGHQGTAGTLSELGAALGWVDADELRPNPAEPSGEAVACAVSPDSAAYVIYTSGSTGRSKGVVVTHGGVVNYVTGLLERLALPAGSNMALLSTVAADLGNTVLFGALCSGSGLHVVSEARAFDPDALGEYFRAHAVDVLKITPSHLKGLLQAADPAAVLPRHTLVLGGEAASEELLASLRQHGQCRVFNHYGPTETTVGVLTHPYAGEQVGSLPLGKALPGSSVYVLDADLQPLPAGVPGEIYIGGAGVARGYLNRPDLSADRFVPDPYGEPGARLYRSGDRAKYLADGSIQFLGRLDDQIKLRGYRIELGEIRAELLGLPEVQDVYLSVQQRPAVGARLLAYLIGREGYRDTESVRQRLEGRLPSYMVPAEYLWLDHFPLTPNGKLDRKALPDPDEAPGQPASAAGRAAQTPAEEALVAIWKEVLGRSAVGVRDNFFSVGGDSLLAFQVIALARKARLRITPAQLFAHQTIAELATVAEVEPEGAAPAEVLGGEVGLTAIQRWFFETFTTDRHHYNQAVMLEVAEPLDLERLEGALQALVARHDALRLRFDDSSGEWRQSYAEAPESSLGYRIDLSFETDLPLAIAEAANAAQRSLNLAEGPLLRAVYMDAGASAPGRLLLVIHHLVVDGVSWRIVLEDLQSLYAQADVGHAAAEPKTTSFQRWSERLAEYAWGDALERELPYWLGVVSETEPGLPVARPDGDNSVASARTIEVELSEAETAALLSEAPRAYRTLVNDLLLTALAHALCDWSGQRSALVQVEGHGREDLFEGVDLSRTVGWFTSLRPVRLTPDRADLERSICGVKEALRAAPHQGIGYGLLRHLSPHGSALAAHPAPRVTFNYLGQFDQTFQAGGLFRPSNDGLGDERSPAGQRDRWFDVSGMVFERRLQISFQYSSALHDAADVQTLADAYRSELQRLIRHCLEARGALTPSDVPLAKATTAELASLPVAAREIETLYPLTPVQQGILFHATFDADGEAAAAAESGDEASPAEGAVYLSQTVVELRVELDTALLRRAWQLAIERYDVLRTSFAWDGLAEPLQIVSRSAALAFDELDLSGLAPSERDRAEREYLQRDQRRGFDLTQAPLLRVATLRLGPGQYRLVWTYHHIVLDGWSAWRVLGDVFADYRALSTGERPAPVEPPRYQKYVAWLAQQDREQAERFWRDELLGLPGPTSLSGRLPRGSETGYARVTRMLSRATTQRLEQHARAHSLTLNTLFQGALALVLGAYTGEREVVLGVTVSGRDAGVPGVERMVGLFINTLPLRVKLAPDARADEWLSRLQLANANLREFGYTPLVDIQRYAGASRTTLFDTLFVFENYPIDQALGDVELGTGQLETLGNTSYPLTLEVAPGPEILMQLDHELAYLDREFASGMLEHLEAALLALADGPALELRSMSLLGAEQRARVLESGSRVSPLPVENVYELFEARARQTPDAPAVIQGSRSLSYGELNRRANRLARDLRARGVGPDVLVGLAMPRSFEMVVGLLAILKAGGAYVPLDLDLPEARLRHVLGDARPVAVLGVERLEAQVPVTGIPLILVDREAERLEAYPAHDLEPLASHRSLAYVLYTSGSTGVPKGTLIQHRGLTNHATWMAGQFGIGSADRVLQLSAFSFDASVCEFWVPLISGGACVLLPEEALGDAARLVDCIRRHHITLMQAVPPLLRALLDTEGGHEALKGVRSLISTGEALPLELLGTLLRVRNAPVFNLYGPTEITVDATFWTCGEEELRAGVVPIGSVITNTATYILDAQLQPTPPGVIGELYVGGIGLARGYLGRPDLSAERFLPNPFGAEGARMYRTGDLARYTRHGVVEYLGRCDRQVKVRGFRIELEEIEARLGRQSGVKEGVVVLWGDAGADPRIVAYVVPVERLDPGEPAEAFKRQVRAGLSLSLPEYMVPAFYVLCDALPLMSSGKLDRKALPAPDLRSATSEHVAPASELEQKLADIWQRVLGVSNIGVTDNFFDLGGDSIVAMQLASRAKSAGIRLTPREVFQHQTILALASAVGTRPATSVPRAPAQAEVALTPVQHWLFEQKLPEPEHYNQSVLLEVDARVRPDLLEQALGSLVAHHDGLRLRFRREGGAWTQRYEPASAAGLLRTVDLRGEADLAAAIQRVGEDVQRGADLDAGPLLRAAHLLTGEGGAGRLLVVAHHLVVDGVSWRILLSDLTLAYAQLEAGQPVELPEPTSSFLSWSQALLAYSRGPALEAELGYWQAVVRDAEPGLFPRDSRHAGATPELERSLAEQNSFGRARSVHAELTADETRQLLTLVPQTYRTQIDDALLAAFGSALCEWSGRSDVLVELEGHGRQELEDGLDLTRSVGWFTALYPVRLRPAAGDVGQSLVAVKEQLRELPNKGIGYGVLRYLTEAGQVLARHAEPRATFNYLGQVDGVLGGDATSEAPGPFRAAPEATGAEHSPLARRRSWLEVNCLVHGQRLQFDWDYGADLYTPEQMQRLADAFCSALRDLLRLCQGDTAAPMASSDFKHVQIESGELDELLGDLG